MSLQLRGSSGSIAVVDATGNLGVRLPADGAEAGFASLADSDSPDRVLEISEDFRIRGGTDSVLLFDKFNNTVINQSLYAQNVTTFTIAQANGRVRLNNGAVTTTGAVARINSYRVFPVTGNFPLYASFTACPTNLPQANAECEIGLAFISGTSVPTDGVYFQYTTSGTLVAKINLAGVETSLPVDVPPRSGFYHRFLICISSDAATFWIDDVKVATHTITGTAGDGAYRTLALPAVVRLWNNGTPPLAPLLDLAVIDVSLGDMNNSKPWPDQSACAGLGGYQYPSGSGQTGTTTNRTNSLSLVSNTLSNTVAPSGGTTGGTLGGSWQFAAVAGAATDYMVFVWQNPAATATANGRAFVCTGVTINTVNTGAAVAGTAHILEWNLGIGGSLTSLATADSATATGARIIALGIQSFIVGAAIGELAVPIEKTFPTPVIIDPGKFLHLILQMPVATATGSQVIRGTAYFNGYFD